MVDYDFKPNSHKYKEEQKKALEEKKIKKVVSGNVKTKKKNEIRKFTDVFISEDITSVKSYIFTDILVPSIKKAISDIVTSGIDMILYGEAGNRNKKRSSVGYVSYNNFSDKKDPVRHESKSRFDYNDLVFESRAEAEAVREQMENIIEGYGFVTIADMYDMVDMTAPFTSNKYGWTNIRNAEIARVRDGNGYGYIIKLPRAMAIN